MLVTLTNQQGAFTSSRTMDVNTVEEYNSLIKMMFNEATLDDFEKGIINGTREYLKTLATPQQPTEGEGGESRVEESG